MNTYGTIILLALLVKYFVDWYTTKLNLKALSNTIPPEFTDVFDEQRYATSLQYIRTRTEFEQFGTSFDLMALLLVWYAGGFTWLDSFTRSFGWSSIAAGVVFISILLAANFLISMPFAWYSTFVIEERFGFNKTTLNTFISDKLKAIGLYAILGIPLVMLVLWFFESTGSFAWLYCWAAITAISIGLQFIVPTVILPLFNKFTPLAEGELRSAVTAYTQSVQFPLKGLFVIDGSKRSSRANAFFTGFGKNKRIALYDTLIAGHTIPELVGILAHEVGHYKKHHVMELMALSIAQQGLMLYILSVFLHTPGLYEAFGISTPSIHAGLVFFSLLYTPISFIVGIATNVLSRKNEFEADEYAARTTRDSASMITALKKLTADNYGHLTPHPSYVFLNYSHPPTLQRVRALAALQL